MNANNIDDFFVKDVEIFAKKYFDYLSKVLNSIDTEEIKNFVNILLEAREAENTIFFIGNGGSAATSSHFANDLAIGADKGGKSFRVISLTDNNAILTAVGNDFGFGEIFVRYLKTLAKPGDILVAISASGNSVNLLTAFDYAKVNGIRTVAITAFDGGLLKKKADYNVFVPTGEKEYGPAEDAHMILDHLIGSYLMRLLD